jgi:hypothetical protein
MHTRTLLGRAIAAALISATAMPLDALANDCRVRYQYNTTSGDRPVVELTIPAGQVQSIGRSRLDFVENIGINDVMLQLENVPNLMVNLYSSQRDPATGFHLSAAARLVSVQCLPSATPPPGSPEAWAAAMRTAGATAQTVATGLKQFFNRSLSQTLQILQSIGYAAEQAAAATKAVFEPTATAMANGLSAAFNTTLAQTAQILRNIGYTAQQVAAALKAAFDATATHVAQQLQSLFNFTAAQTAALLKQVEYNAGQVGAALRDRYQQTEAQVLKALGDAGFTVAQTIEAARSLYNAGAEQVATWMRQAGYTLQQIGNTLIQQFNLNAEAALRAFMNAGFQLQEAVNEVRTRFNLALEDTIRVTIIILQESCGAGGCPTTQLREALEQLFATIPSSPTEFANAVARVTRNTLQSTAEEAARLMEGIGQITRDIARAALLAAGWAAAEVEAALDAVYGVVQSAGAYTELVESYTSYAPTQDVPVSQRIGATIAAKGMLANTATGMTMGSRGWQVSKVEPGGAIIGPATPPCNELNTLCINAVPGSRGAAPGRSSITVSYPGGFSQTIPVRIVQHANVQGVTNQPFSRSAGVTLTRSSCDLNATETFDLDIQGENLALGRELRMDCPTCSAGTTVSALSSSANSLAARVTVNNINRVTGTIRLMSPHSERHPEMLSFRVEERRDCDTPLLR